MAKSLMEQIALLPEDQRNAVLSDMDMDTLLWDWKAWGRPEQQAPRCSREASTHLLSGSARLAGHGPGLCGLQHRRLDHQ